MLSKAINAPRRGDWRAVRALVSWCCVALLAWTLVLGTTLAGEPALRFAWLSDTHVGSNGGEPALRACIDDINAMTNLDFVVISGDLTEAGTLDQFHLAKELLAALKIPCHIVPGNHDTKWSESGATDFARVLGDEHLRFEHGGVAFLGIQEGPIMRMGDGHFAPSDLHWLDDALKALPDRDTPVIFVTHYPLDGGVGGLDNAFEAVDRLKKVNTQVALTGHVHHNGSMDCEGVPVLTGRSILVTKEAGAGFNLVDIHEGTLTVSERLAGKETLPAWHTMKLAAHRPENPQPAGPRPDFSINQKYPAVHPAWRVKTGQTIASSPVLWKKTVIVGDGAGVIHGLDVATGRERWRYASGGPVYSTPDVANNTVVFGSTDGSIHALRASDGALRWKFATDRPVVACPRIADGKVFVGASDERFRALALDTGRLLWQAEGIRGFVESRPVVHQDRVIFGAWDGHLYALDARTGARAWTWQGENTAKFYSPAACWPVAVKDRVFIVAPDRKMTAIDVATGKNLWRTNGFEVRESLGLSADGRRLYVRAMHDRVAAYDTEGAEARQLWELNAHFGFDVNPGCLVEKDGVVFHGIQKGIVLAIDGRTGKLLWQHRVGATLLNTVLALNGHSVITTDFEGDITRIDAAAEKP